MNPNWEYNERHTVVVFDDLGERKKNSEAGARFPTKLEIVPAENTADSCRHTAIKLSPQWATNSVRSATRWIVGSEAVHVGAGG
jgi:hypothetical protein